MTCASASGAAAASRTTPVTSKRGRGCITMVAESSTPVAIVRVTTPSNQPNLLTRAVCPPGLGANCTMPSAGVINESPCVTMFAFAPAIGSPVAPSITRRRSRPYVRLGR